MGELIDISVALEPGIPTWPGSPGLRTRMLSRMDRGDAANGSALDMDVHVGTHVDAPLHFVADGASVESLPLDALVGAAWVAVVSGHEPITRAVLEALEIPPVERLLLRTSNSALWHDDPRPFRPDYVALKPDAAEWVVERGIRLVGIDYLSIQCFDDDPSTHRILLGAGVVVLEGLDLTEVEGGAYELIALPLKLAGAEGAPARAVLRRTAS